MVHFRGFYVNNEFYANNGRKFVYFDVIINTQIVLKSNEDH